MEYDSPQNTSVSTNSSALMGGKQKRQHINEGRIEMIIGPMFAGKSTELIRRVTRHEISGKRVLRVKYSEDNRYDNENCISTHDRQKKQAVSVRELKELNDIWKTYDVIGIDEGQFFKDIVEFCETAANCGKIVITSALSGTYLREPFNNILELVPKAEKIKTLSAICKGCMVPAHFTLRTRQTNDLELIGGEDMYMPVCRECFIEKTNEQKMEAQRLANKENNQDILKSPEGQVISFQENDDEESLISKDRGQRPTQCLKSNSESFSPLTNSTNSSPEIKQE